MMWLTLFACGASHDRIKPADLAAKLANDPTSVHVVDVRTQTEFRSSKGHIVGAISRPYPGVMWNSDGLRQTTDQTIVLICLTGHRSRFPLNTFRKQYPGATVVDLEGGMRAWWSLGLPTVVSDK